MSRFEIFILGVLVGLVMSDYLGRAEYRKFVRDIPEFLKEKES